MDERHRYGSGVLLLGLGNLVYGVSQLLLGGQTMLVVALEISAGVLLTVFGGAVVREPDRIDPEQISPRILRTVGWIGFFLGVGLLAWTTVLLIETV